MNKGGFPLGEIFRRPQAMRAGAVRYLFFAGEIFES